MKKVISILTIFALLALVVFSMPSYAVTLTLDVETDKTIVRPGEAVTLSVGFGTELASYDFNVFYDDNIFDFISVEGGQSNDTGDKVIISNFDTQGGVTQRTNMRVTFKAKEDITTSNSTELTLTASGLASVTGGTTVTYEDVTTPIVKTLTVEPEYVDYTIKLEYSGEIVKEQEIPMVLSYASPMGKYYNHIRLEGSVTTPEGATAQLLATDQAGAEHDILESGWGDPQGYAIGGKNVSQVLQTIANFSDAGEYTINLKLINRDNSDIAIAEENFTFNVLEMATLPTTQEPESPTKNEPKEEPKQTPTVLPKTGENIYIPATIILATLMGGYIYYNKKK